MTKAVYFKVYVKIRPFDSLRTGHLYVEYATDRGILHPRDTVIGQEVVMSLYGKHDSLSINHQHAYQCVDGIERIFAFATEYRTHRYYVLTPQR